MHQSLSMLQLLFETFDLDVSTKMNGGCWWSIMKTLKSYTVCDNYPERILNLNFRAKKQWLNSIILLVRQKWKWDILVTFKHCESVSRLLVIIKGIGTVVWKSPKCLQKDFVPFSVKKKENKLIKCNKFKLFTRCKKVSTN